MPVGPMTFHVAPLYVVRPISWSAHTDYTYIYIIFMFLNYFICCGGIKPFKNLSHQLDRVQMHVFSPLLYYITHYTFNIVTLLNFLIYHYCFKLLLIII